MPPSVVGRVVARGVAALAGVVAVASWAAATPASSQVPGPTQVPARGSSAAQGGSGRSAAAASAAPFTQAWAALQHRLDLEQQRQARVPIPVGFRFKPKKIGTLDLRPDIAATAVADLDRDGRLEAFVAGENTVAVVSFLHGPRIVANVRFPDIAQRRSRQLVGSLHVVGAELRAQVSSHANPIVVQWNGNGYTGATGGAPNTTTVAAASAGFEFCKDQTWPLHPGRNWFDTGVVGQGAYNAVCRDDLVDAQGHFWSMRASVSEHDVLHVETQAHCDTTCGAVQPFDMTGAGYAVAIDDLDQNGVPEVVASAASANADTVTITELSSPPRVVLRRRFAAGVVGLLTGDFDGDGRRDAIALVRAGKRIDVWRLQ